MIKNKLKILKKKFKKLEIDGYIIPKNDEYFSEYAKNDRLKNISNFSGSAGIAVILKKNNYLFVDGRYTIQAQKECAKNFKIIEIHKKLPGSIIKNCSLGYDPRLFTSINIKNYFLDNKLISIDKNLIDQIFISAPENVAWLLNIRGYDNPNSPIPNARLIVDKDKKLFLITKKNNAREIIRQKKIKEKQIVDISELPALINKLTKKNFIIDKSTCSIFYENIIKLKFEILDKTDPIYKLKSIKNLYEINHMIEAHKKDGLALTKFIYWIKNINKKIITEVDAQNKLETFRKLNNNYLYPSFNTIAGSGSNGAIVHYRAMKKNTKNINKKDIFLCDSGGQYHYGTTDVTRTICFSEHKQKIKDIFTNVLKGHIAVALTDLKKDNTGKKIDIRARKFLKKGGLDYAHGTGHGVGFFLNVHEGPQSISKYNSIKIEEGMVLSNEPGYYKKNSFGMRIENLVYVKKFKNKLYFENLTLAPIEKDLINYRLLNKIEKDYLFKYHLNIYSEYSSLLNKKERKWLATLI